MPVTSPSVGRMKRGFGLDPIRSDVPIGSAASIVIHGSILIAALAAWQSAPRIMPEDVIAVDMVSDTPSVIGQNTAPETAQTGVDTPSPSPIPQPLPPAPQAEPAPSQSVTEQPPPAEIAPPPPVEVPAPSQTAAPPPPPPPLPQVRPAPPPPPSPKEPTRQPTPAPRPTPTAKAAPQPLPKPAPAPTVQPGPKAAPIAKAPAQPVPKAAAPAARPGARQANPAPPIEFDLAAATTSASGADSGGRRTPQLAARGQAGRLGKAGGGAQLTGDLEAALRSQIQPCWLEPANMAEAGRLLVVVSIDLGIDGRLQRDPVLVSPSSRAGASPSLVVAIDNAMRAVRECQPFNLPPDRYDTWRQVRFNFDPQRMARR